MMSAQFLTEDPKGREEFGDLRGGGMIILKLY